VEEIRCSSCNKKLAEADYRQLVIKCPRCRAINTLKAIEPPVRAKAQKERTDESAQ
jgi:phage FluMu protein Com